MIRVTQWFSWFPCAGVIWKGDKLINGVPETLDMLRSMVNPVFTMLHFLLKELWTRFFSMDIQILSFPMHI
jgi:hypothetical protein